MENFKHTGLTEKIIRSAFEVYNYFGGPGFLESVYEKALAIELRKNDLKVETQSPISVFYKSELVGDFRADLIVNDTIIVELKSVSEIQEIHEVQLVNYLRATPIEVGLLFNFGNDEKLQIKRRVFSNWRKVEYGRLPENE